LLNSQSGWPVGAVLAARRRAYWRRHMAIRQTAVAPMLAADDPDHNSHDDNKVIHARHH
jgi:hypothetical protein